MGDLRLTFCSEITIMSIRFDANGNIDPSSLEDDLMKALDSDCKYKQTDNMKKRAIRVAKSYDEFKNMVACAHLKTVRWKRFSRRLINYILIEIRWYYSREDIESLKAVKKGWKKQSAKAAGSISLLAEDEAIIPAVPVSIVPDVHRIKKPKTSFEFERNWRRLAGAPEKIE